MKRIVTLLSSLALFSLNLLSVPVSVETAQKAGQAFMAKSVIANYSGSLKIKPEPTSLKLVYTADTLRFDTNNLLPSANKVIEWNAMPNSVTSSNSAVATLMYHCGVAVEMNYNVASQGGSGAMTICSGYSNCTVSVENALKTYFGYKSSLLGIHKSNYSADSWTSLLKTELNARRPIVYAGRGNEGGHFFVCDGYDNNTYFHFNWGWSGQNDGYFALNGVYFMHIHTDIGIFTQKIVVRK